MGGEWEYLAILYSLSLTVLSGRVWFAVVPLFLSTRKGLHFLGGCLAGVLAGALAGLQAVLQAGSTDR